MASSSPVPRALSGGLLTCLHQREEVAVGPGQVPHAPEMVDVDQRP
jgi:hypothetical protein